MTALIFGCLLGLLSLLFWFLQRQQKQKLQNVKAARPTTVQELQDTAKAIDEAMGGGNWRDYVKLRGQIASDQPLLSEIKQESCVYYHTQVTQDYETVTYKRDPETSQRTKETKRSTETLVNQTRSVPFLLKDQTGQILIEPAGADFEKVEILNQFEPATADVRTLQMGPFSFQVPTPPTGRQVLGYRYQESIVPIGQTAMVIGTVSDENGNLVIRQSTQSDQRFIVSFKSDEVYAAEASKSAQRLFYMAVGCGIGAVGLILLGLL